MKTGGLGVFHTLVAAGVTAGGAWRMPRALSTLGTAGSGRLGAHRTMTGRFAAVVIAFRPTGSSLLARRPRVRVHEAPGVARPTNETTLLAPHPGL